MSSFLDSSFIPKTAHVAASAQSFPQFQSKIDAEPGFAGYDWQGASSQDAKRKTAGWKPVSNTASLGIETAWVVDDGSKSTGIPIVEKKKPAWNPFLAGNVWGEKNKS